MSQSPRIIFCPSLIHSQCVSGTTGIGSGGRACADVGPEVPCHVAEAVEGGEVGECEVARGGEGRGGEFGEGGVYVYGDEGGEGAEELDVVFGVCGVLPFWKIR